MRRLRTWIVASGVQDGIRQRSTHRGDHRRRSVGDFPAVRYYPPTGDLYFDVLTRIGEAATVDAEVKEVAGVRVRVATPAALCRMKQATVPAKDHQDAAALRERFKLTDDH